MGGLIRFVGGYFHNRTINIESWIPRLTLPMPYGMDFSKPLIAPSNRESRCEDYRLVQLWKYDGPGIVYFCEYHLDSLTEREAMELRRDNPTPPKARNHLRY